MVGMGVGVQLIFIVFPGKEKSYLLNRQKHSKSPLAIENVVPSISAAPCCQISLLKDFFFNRGC